jgi:hypothetical protein
MDLIIINIKIKKDPWISGATPLNEQQELSLNANQDSDSEYGFDSQWT